MKYLTTILLNIDALGGSIIYGCPPGFYISTWVKLKGHKRTERFINWLFRNPNHCEESVQSQKEIISKYYKG